MVAVGTSDVCVMFSSSYSANLQIRRELVFTMFIFKMGRPSNLCFIKEAVNVTGKKI